MLLKSQYYDTPVLGTHGPPSGSAQLYKAVPYCVLYVAEPSKTPHYTTTCRIPYATVLYNCAPRRQSNEAQNEGDGML
jgi:hypothetical protein